MKKQKIKTADDGRLRCSNGITIKSDVELSLSKQSSAFFPVIQLMVTIISALSVIFMMQSFLNADGDYYMTNGSVVCMAVTVTAVSALMSTMQQKFFKVIGFLSLLANAAYIVRNIGDVVKGFMYSVYLYSKRASFVSPLFAHEANDFMQSQLEMFFLAAAFFVTLIVSIACIYYINFPVLFFVTFPVFELGTFWGWEPYTWTVLLMAAGWIITLSLNLINHSAKKRNSSSTFAVYLRKKAFFLTNESIKKRFFGSASTFIIAVTALVLVITASFALLSRNYRPESFKQLRRDISLGFREFTMELSDRIENGGVNMPGRGKAVGGTNGGKLGLYDEIKFNGSTSLRVALDEKPYMPIYLRGYAGERYKNNSWEAMRINESVKNTFAGDGLNVLDYDYIQYHNDLYPDAVTHEISIRPVNAADDIVYAPYGADYAGCDNIEEQEFDGVASPIKLRKTYTMNYSIPEYSIGNNFTYMCGMDEDGNLFIYDEDHNITEIIEGGFYSEDELNALIREKCGYLYTGWDNIIDYLISQMSSGVYRNEYTFYDDFITSNLDTYLYVPDELQPLLDSILAEAGTSREAPLITQHKAICDYFIANYTYDTAPGVTPKGEDFVKYFLTTQKKGYCTYFASAGVMLMRELGVPARYVEGYVIMPEQYSEKYEDIIVSDRSAHAWCEVFIPGYGWYPLEFTNSYSEDDNPNLTDKERNKIDDSSNETESKSDSSSSKKPSDSSSKRDSSSRSGDRSAANSSKPDSSRPEAQSKPQNDNRDNSANHGGGGGGGTGTGGGPSALNKTQLTYISMTALILVLAMLAAVVRRKTKLDRLERAINSKDCNKAVISCYTAFLQYITLLGINEGRNLTDVQLSSRLSGELEKLSPGLSTMFMKLSEPAITAYMSRSKANPEEAAQARRILSAAKRDIFSRISFGKRFAAKWVYGFY